MRLEDGDVIAVQGTGGIDERPAVVYVKGAVNSPGPIILKNKNVRLSDAIAEAGGLRPEAFPEGAEFNRDPAKLSSKTQRELAAIDRHAHQPAQRQDFKQRTRQIRHRAPESAGQTT